jgi:hypothetical protein
MNLATRKYNFIQELVIDESLLENLKLFLKPVKKRLVHWFEFRRKLEIEIGLKQAENDEFISHETYE